jgi:tetratricopeptide (TPR) repeat protein
LPTVLDKKFDYDRHAADLKNTGYHGWLSPTELFLTNYDEGFLLQNQLALKLCHKLGSYYVHEKRDMKNALIWLQKTEKALLSGSENFLALLMDVYIDMQKAFAIGGEYSQCEAYAKKVLAHNKAWQTGDIRSLDEAYACQAIAFLKSQKGNWRLSEQYHLQILTYLESYIAPHSVKYRHLLAVTCHMLGKVETKKKYFLRAIDYARQSREIFAQFLPDNHYEFWSLLYLEAHCFTELSDEEQLRKTREEAVRLTDSWADLHRIEARYDYAASCIKLGDRETAAALHIQIFDLIRDNSSLQNAITFGGDTLLLLAASNGHLEMVRWLLDEEEAKIHEVDGGGATALLRAAGAGQLEMVKWLLHNSGADIKETDKNDATALI